MRQHIGMAALILNVLWKLAVLGLLASIALDIHDLAGAVYDDSPATTTSMKPRT